MSLTDQLAEAAPIAWEQTNIIDAALLLILALFVMNGVRRGLVSSLAGLTSLALSVVLAIKFYGPAAELLLQRWQLSGFIVNIIGFFAVLVSSQILFAVVLAVAASMLRPLRPWLGPLIAADHLLGAVPGLLRGTIVAALLLTPLHILPLSNNVQQMVDESALVSHLTRTTAAALPQLETLFGQAVHNTMLFRARVVTQEGDAIQFGPFPLPDLIPDTDSESSLFALVNAARARESLPPLVMDHDLREVARAHSAEMFRLRYFSHSSPVTGQPADRIRSQDIPYTVAGENLAYAPTVEVAHAGLMNSPGHRQNVLANEYGKIGIGVISGGVYGKMFTQNFTN